MTWTRWLLEKLCPETMDEVKKEARKAADKLWFDVTGQDLYVILAKRDQAARLVKARKDAQLTNVAS